MVTISLRANSEAEDARHSEVVATVAQGPIRTVIKPIGRDSIKAMQKTAVNLIRRNKFCASIKNAYICIIDVRGQGYCQNIIVAEGE
jgi:hypothetical protein